MRLAVFAAFLVLLLAGLGSAGTILVAGVPEQLVEGHTVFVTIEPARNSTSGLEFASAVAVLVREYETARTVSRFPGVLWFNDQYLVDPSTNVKLDDDFRYPCTGAVLAVNQGDTVPRNATGVPFTGNATYVESYLITDPQNHVWIIDRWDLWMDAPSFRVRPLWSVAILGSPTGQTEADDGKCRGGAYSDGKCSGQVMVPYQGCLQGGPRFSAETFLDGRAKNPGDHGIGYPCSNGTRRCQAIQYNALLYFRLRDLDDPGATKDHAEGQGADWWNDASGCHPNAYRQEWPCPGGDDDREGNSHPYNPDAAWPLQDHDGRNNHGGSEDCDGDGLGDLDCHATRRVEIHFGYAALPASREYWITDAVGSSAPYHCHDDIALCSADDASP